MVSYKDLIRAIENAGIATSYVIQYYSVGSLNPSEMIQFLQAQVIAAEYLEQASNFSPEIEKTLKTIKQTNYSELIQKR